MDSVISLFRLNSVMSQPIISQELRIIVFILIIAIIDRIYRSVKPEFLYILFLVGLIRALWPPAIQMPTIVIPAQEFPDSTVLMTILTFPSRLQGHGEPAGSGPGILLLWYAASATIAGVLVMRFVLFRLRIRNSHPTQVDTSQLVSGFPTKFPEVYVCEEVHSPVTVGFFRPRIYLPGEILHLNSPLLKAVLFHEAAHVLRYDAWVSLLQGITLVLHPLNPFLWFLNRRLSEYRELSCDNHALRSSNVDSVEYGKMLLFHLPGSLYRSMLISPRTCFSGRRNGLSKRMRHLKQWKEDSMYGTLNKMQSLIVFCLMLVMVTTGLQCQAETPVASDESPGMPGKVKKVAFVPYDTPPSPIGGYDGIRQNVVYPEDSRKNKSEGMVVLQLQVLENGKTGEYIEVLVNTSEDPLLEEAAIRAVRNVAWKPASRGDENVSVWITLPVRFQLGK